MSEVEEWEIEVIKDAIAILAKALVAAIDAESASDQRDRSRLRDEALKGVDYALLRIDRSRQ